MLDISTLLEDTTLDDKMRLFKAYEQGCKDAEQHWCAYLGACIDDLATALNFHAPERAEAILNEHGIEFTSPSVN